MDVRRKRGWGDNYGGEPFGEFPFLTIGGFDPYWRGRGGLGPDYFGGLSQAALPMPALPASWGTPTTPPPPGVSTSGPVGVPSVGGGGGGLATIDWRADPRWQQFPDTDRVYFNPNIDGSTIWRPRADVFDESKNLVRVEFELPGVPSEDIELSVVDNTITVAALKPQTRKEEGGYYFQRERHFGRFFRSLQLPYNVDSNNVRANLDNGVLKVVLVKFSASSKIQIQQGTPQFQPIYTTGSSPTTTTVPGTTTPPSGV